MTDKQRERIAQVLTDYRDGLGDGLEWAVEAIEEVLPQWRPIAAAPKDGTHVLLLYRYGHRDRFIAEGWWSSRNKAWNTGNDAMVRAIEWMELPAPAAAEPTPERPVAVGHTINAGSLADDEAGR